MNPKRRLIIIQTWTTINDLISFPPYLADLVWEKKLLRYKVFPLLLTNSEDKGRNIPSIFWRNNLNKH